MSARESWLDGSAGPLLAHPPAGRFSAEVILEDEPEITPYGDPDFSLQPDDSAPRRAYGRTVNSHRRETE